MKILFSSDAIKFIDKIDNNIKEMIRTKLNQLLEYMEDKNELPFGIMDLKYLKGKWKDCLRLRVGKIRIIMRIDTNAGLIFVYVIGYRGGIY